MLCRVKPLLALRQLLHFGGLEVKKEKIKLLIGDNTAASANTAQQLSTVGWEVCCTERNPLDVQMKALSEKFDAIVIFTDAGYSDVLVTNLRDCVHDCLLVSVGNECGADISLSAPLNSSAIYNTLCCRLELTPVDISIQLDDNARLHNSITKIISGLCITPRYNGYNYLREAIKIAVSTDDNSLGVSKNIYPEIAKRCCTSASAVERGIRTAIHRGWEKTAMATKINFFGTYASRKDWTPTNSEFIFIIADKLCCEFNNAGLGL